MIKIVLDNIDGYYIFAAFQRNDTVVQGKYDRSKYSFAKCFCEFINKFTFQAAKVKHHEVIKFMKDERVDALDASHKIFIQLIQWGIDVEEVIMCPGRAEERAKFFK